MLLSISGNDYDDTVANFSIAILTLSLPPLCHPTPRWCREYSDMGEIAGKMPEFTTSVDEILIVTSKVVE